MPAFPVAIPRRLALTLAALCMVVLSFVGRPLAAQRTPGQDPRPKAAMPGPLRFIVSFGPEVRSTPASGRILLFLSRTGASNPALGADWFNLQPVFGIDVTNLPPGEAVIFDAARFKAPDALAFPGPLGALEAGTYTAQALFDLDSTGRDYATGPGNLHSRSVPCRIGPGGTGTVLLPLEKTVEPRPTPADTDSVKLIEHRSKLLSDFHGRDITLRAGVILPSSFHRKTDAQFPAIYIVPGFGGRHTAAWSMAQGERGKRWLEEGSFQILRVVLDPDVPLGHSVFANSANNGPVGDALVQELIPEIEKRFRAIPSPNARFVTGHSSGGWSSLWLQVAYPDFFGGCWSTAPDPVDFRAFQTMNIYEDRNGHWTREGWPRPVARRVDQVAIPFLKMHRWEYVIGYGGQLDSFDAVFSPRGPDGRPRPLINKLGGAIDRSIAEHWKRYDIRLQLEQNWSTLGPKLRGKLHVIGGAWDTFYLEPAVELLRDSLSTMDHGGYVEILPGDHGSVMTDAVRDRIDREIAETFHKAQAPGAEDQPR